MEEIIFGDISKRRAITLVPELGWYMDLKVNQQDEKPQKDVKITLSQLLKPRLRNSQSSMPPRNTFLEYLILAKG